MSTSETPLLINRWSKAGLTDPIGDQAWKTEAIPVSGKAHLSQVPGLGVSKTLGWEIRLKVSGLSLGVILKWAESITYFDQCQEVLQTLPFIFQS